MPTGRGHHWWYTHNVSTSLSRSSDQISVAVQRALSNNARSDVTDAIEQRDADDVFWIDENIMFMISNI
jgi:hypothetical protein